MAASFFKNIPADKDSRQLFGAFFQPGSFSCFQMVPFNDERKWEIKVSGGTVATVFSRNKDFAGVALDDGTAPQDKLTFKADGIFRIVSGARTGFTFILAQDENGLTRDHIAVSVKSQVPLRVRGVLLSDATHKAAVTQAESETVIREVAELYLNQTNMKLASLGTSNLFIQRVLSDKNGVLQLQERFDNKHKVILKAVQDNGLGGVDVAFVFTWELEGKPEDLLSIADTGLKLDGRTETGSPTLVYVSKASSMTFTAAHELGHALGLNHTGVLNRRPPNFLMEGGGPGASSRTLRMTPEDINTVNKTGLNRS